MMPRINRDGISDAIPLPRVSGPIHWQIDPCPAGCSQEQCGHPNISDITKPILQVYQEQPGVDGYCYFIQLGAYWLKSVPAVLQSRSFAKSVARNDAMGHVDMGNASK